MNIARLSDCENADPASIHGILSELAEKGAILPIQQFAYTKGKNAVVMCMAIDAFKEPAADNPEPQQRVKNNGCSRCTPQARRSRRRLRGRLPNRPSAPT